MYLIKVDALVELMARPQYQRRTRRIFQRIARMRLKSLLLYFHSTLTAIADVCLQPPHHFWAAISGDAGTRIREPLRPAPPDLDVSPLLDSGRALGQCFSDHQVRVHCTFMLQDDVVCSNGRAYRLETFALFFFLKPWVKIAGEVCRVLEYFLFILAISLRFAAS